MDVHLIIYIFVTLLLLYTVSIKLTEPAEINLAQCRISYVYDGDTVALDCGNGDVTARLRGFDTPETKSPGCGAERALGNRATQRLRELVALGDIAMAGHVRDKYGRVLVNLSVGGRDVGDTLIEEGLAYAYRGGSRINWCDRLE